LYILNNINKVISYLFVHKDNMKEKNSRKLEKCITRKMTFYNRIQRWLEENCCKKKYVDNFIIK